MTVIAPKSIADMFRDFWGTYGQFIGIFACAFIGAFAKVLFDRRNMNLQNRLDGKFVLESVDAEESCGCMVTLILTSNNKIWIHIKNVPPSTNRFIGQKNFRLIY